MIPRVQQMWEIKHEWWMEDFEFMFEQAWNIKQLLKHHPDDEIGYIFRDMLKTIEKKTSVMKREYKKIYGDLPPLIRMKREIENIKQIRARADAVITSIIDE